VSKAASGAIVKFCGHNGCFAADIFEAAGANVVRANGPVSPANLNRKATPTHHIIDFPKSGFWRPDLGVFVVPKAQVCLTADLEMNEERLSNNRSEFTRSSNAQ
jgi:hypothetical protein